MSEYTKGNLVAQVMNILEKEYEVQMDDLGMIAAAEIEERLPLIAAAPKLDRENKKLKKQVTDLLQACKTAKEAVYLAINGNKSKLSHVWHGLKAAIDKAEPKIKHPA